MKTKLNDTSVDRLKHKSERYDVRDTVERGLLLRVGKKPGQKQWYTFIYRGSKRQMLRLGGFPQMNVKDARLAAIAAKGSVDQPQAPEHIKTVSDLFAAYKDFKEPKLRAWRDVQSAWDTWGYERIGHLRLTDISVHNGRDLRNHVTKLSSELRGNAVIRYLRPMFSWAADESLIDVNPWAGLKANVVAAPRERVLSQQEWQSLWDISYGDNLGAFFRFLMLSAQRRGNVASMRWDEIEGDVWTIPAAKFKATRSGRAKAHEVPMSQAMMSILRSQPKYGEFVFGVTGKKPLSFGSRQKDRFGEAADVSGWRLHDIRRTGATRMAEGKVSRFIVERILGHADVGVTAVYDRAGYRDEMSYSPILGQFSA